ncbi:MULTISPECIES: hypothetical protein [Haloferax]|uniref:DUF8097 domain-containing protein n=6 Tax=Haloferax TaxID=2251 RepID=A0A384LHQ0_HALVD|nr:MULTISPECIES: hypothetical protein [Haloferax]ADE04343.1 uncharacterized protein HVO_1563 [Haloferax volcanii DS2]ELY35788.1 hypothetical protein C498_03170 [Haloferax volcanii DS2]ELZ74535.1 hypothetical protein C456_09208 [Haloferax lucentense DSM 14919]ELZ93811.1 hypothetical protein C452_03017 [Haloferax alexandrinus JCM 10717]MBC9986308.1 hypothetical protein [Haloferax sp. AS1]
MVSRRTKAVAQLGIAVLTALWMVSMRRLLRSSDDESHEPTPLSPGGLAVGGAWGVGQVWAYDRDCWKVRSNRRRGLVVSLVGLAVERRLLPRTESFTYSLGFGRVLGVVVYRAWYGLLRPLPGGD